MKQLIQGRKIDKPLLRCLPVFLSILILFPAAWTVFPSHAQNAPGAVPSPTQEAPNPFAPPEEPASPSVSKETLAVAERVKEALKKETFAYAPADMIDPFVPFIAPAESVPQTREVTGEEEGDLPPEQKRPLTPLQKMTVAEIERGLRAITWGEMGRKALIEDAAGKGYIVGIGTPAGDKNGMITEIFNDRLVIQQEVWDREARRMVPQNSVVKLKKDVKQQ
ncbi:MAG: hypothetical protein GX443_01080 [Deltaproteobacteria bacterium]|nr:hypothetical protein [Deltaproteobacteria bacterium]